jgi:hypothetical protein
MQDNSLDTSKKNWKCDIHIAKIVTIPTHPHIPQTN